MKTEQEKVVIKKKLYVSATVETLVLDGNDVITSSKDVIQDDIFDQ